MSNPALLQPLVLDVTNADHIISAVSIIEASKKHLVGLVNNAGVVILVEMISCASLMYCTAYIIIQLLLQSFLLLMSDCIWSNGAL